VLVVAWDLLEECDRIDNDPRRAPKLAQNDQRFKIHGKLADVEKQKRLGKNGNLRNVYVLLK
jgi:hypothetical protein